MIDFDFLTWTVELESPQEAHDMVGIKIKMPKACVYENEKGKTEYCPICNHDDVPYCQYLDDDEVGIGVDERPCYCPLIEIKGHTPERTEPHDKGFTCPENRKCMCFQCDSKGCKHWMAEIPNIPTYHMNGELVETHDKRSEMHSCDYDKKETHGDVISRKMLLKDIDSWVSMDSFEQHYKESVREVVENFPSAEPEIIRCKDCKHFEYDHPYIIRGVPLLGHEVCNAWGDGCKTNENGYCFLAERRSDDQTR